ncbi:hypothetical protein DdX_03209 [Ditylenchus destructor]|uniref:Uncharacterized protein n=1 Tax=Ditylenchus destructor TaxID=166010 RepID=A0AAD4NCM5_9BILA|nr:hypothetical protein DdX_03209 [Ditylenchus destructor]
MRRQEVCMPFPFPNRATEAVAVEAVTWTGREKWRKEELVLFHLRSPTKGWTTDAPVLHIGIPSIEFYLCM